MSVGPDYDRRVMAGRSLARLLAPLALVACAAALLLVVTSSLSDDAGTQRGVASGERREAGASTSQSRERQSSSERRRRRSYTVRPGDTLSSIAERTGISQARIEDLNPELDPQTLAPGARIRLR